jgi:hypothetical protein
MKTQAFNPFLPSYEYIPDGEPYVFGNRIYIYGSHDAFNGSDYCVNNYVCWSASVDHLGDWKYEGVIYDKQKDPLCDDVKKRLLFAPDVQLGTDGRYYLYYAFDELSIMSVAVCDTPAGEYEFYGHVHYADGTLLGKKDDDIFQFDPGVYREGDNVYLYSGFCPPPGRWKPKGTDNDRIKGPVVMELETDMLTIRTEPKVITPCIINSKGTDFEGHEFFEASSMRKIRDKYYFIYSSINGHELCYAISDYPDKEFRYGGTIISNGDIYLNGREPRQALNYLGNNHGSIAEINNKYYIFYHRHTNKIQFSRQACAERIEIMEDGSIPQAEITSCGLNDGPLCGKGTYEARIACNLMSKNGVTMYSMGDRQVEEIHPYFTQEGEDREDTPNQYIANIRDGAIAGFKYFHIEGTESISISVRGSGKGAFIVTTSLGGEADKCIAAEIPVNSPQNVSGKWQEYSAKINLPNGVTALYFKYSGEGAFDFYSFTLK